MTMHAADPAPLPLSITEATAMIVTLSLVAWLGIAALWAALS